MIIDFDNKKVAPNIGNKAKFLIMMKHQGFNVPSGIVIDSDTYNQELVSNGIDKKINTLLRTINKDNIKETSLKILKLFDDFTFSDDVIKKVNSLLKKKKKYAVRSSGTKEDLDNYSFAGQYDTFLNVDCEHVLDNVINCYKSMFKEVLLSYFVNNNISFDNFSMSVIVEEMVNSEYSGICFTIDPVNGTDKTMLIEVGKGLGENIVSGLNKPEQYFYNWYDDVVTDNHNKYLSKKMLKEMGQEFYKIMLFFGYPCDIEFAIEKGKLYILQARKITKIKYNGYNYLWSTTDFKDGGVSATICTPFMWSLYEYIWEYTLRKFMIDSNILKDKEIPKKLGDMFYGRCYWNMSAVKKAMSRVVGYKEREFDSEYGINPTYEGDGETTGVTIKSIYRIIRMAIGQSRIVRERNKKCDYLKEDLLNKYNKYQSNYDNNEIDSIKETWYTLTHEDYLYSESTYFWQIFINTIHQSLNKDSLLKHITEEDYLTLIGNIDDISHLLPFYEMWDVSRNIREDKDVLTYWLNNDTSKIVKDLKTKKKNNCFEQVRDIIKNYGYHSDKELDVTYPCYYEDITPIVINIKDLIGLEDSFSPKIDQEKGKKRYEDKLKELSNKLDGKDYKKLEKKIIKIRNMLWWREEFRDLSTRFYYLIRIYTVLLSKELVKEKVLVKEDDIWFLKVGNIWDYLDNKLSKKDILTIIKKNKDYYNSYRHYMSENEIGKVFSDNEKTTTSSIKGLGANNGTITGVARVIESFDEIDRLQEHDILVTKFTDTGWTPKFAILSGIVTEYGGILCHAAIVSREYGIPCIVSCTDAMKKIKDGDIITINGSTGEVIKDKKEG